MKMLLTSKLNHIYTYDCGKKQQDCLSCVCLFRGIHGRCVPTEMTVHPWVRDAGKLYQKVAQ